MEDKVKPAEEVSTSISDSQSQVTISQEELHNMALEGQMRNGASWFYWIAGLSLINSLLFIFDTGRSFIVGLGITQLMDGILSELEIPSIVGLLFAVLVSGMFVGFGIAVIKMKQKWVFIVGMVLYALDALLFLLVMDIFSIAFHGFALYQMFMGYKALEELEKLEV